MDALDHKWALARRATYTLNLNSMVCRDRQAGSHDRQEPCLTALVTILHLAHKSDWAAACETGSYRVSSRGATLEEVGFIHGSYPQQLRDVAEYLYADDGDELCVLVLDDAAIRASGTVVIDEDGGDGELYPHVYGPIVPAFVTAVLPASFDDEGHFRF